MNKITIIGRLTKDPELRATGGGINVCTLYVAVNRHFKRDETDFFTVLAWRGVGENCAKHLVKGQQVAVTGEMYSRNFEDRQGVKRTLWEISADEVEFLGKPQENARTGYDTEQALFAQRMEAIQEDEELPFLS